MNLDSTQLKVDKHLQSIYTMLPQPNPSSFVKLNENKMKFC